MGKNEEELTKVATMYEFIVEYGLVMEVEKLKMFGAGLVCSESESENALSKGKSTQNINLK